MFRSIFAGAFALGLASFIPACASNDGNLPEGSSEDAINSTAIFACHTDADCVAVPKEECCPSGRKDAVNKNHVTQYEHAYACKQKPTVCPLFVINDTRVPECNTSTNKCEMVAITEILCGGFTANPHQCPAGYDCISGPAADPDAPGECAPKTCIQNVLCALSSHFDTTLCQCVPDQPTPQPCPEMVMCIQGDHWDSTLCQCVPN